MRSRKRRVDNGARHGLDMTPWQVCLLKSTRRTGRRVLARPPGRMIVLASFMTPLWLTQLGTPRFYPSAAIGAAITTGRVN